MVTVLVDDAVYFQPPFEQVADQIALYQLLIESEKVFSHVTVRYGEILHGQTLHH